MKLVSPALVTAVSVDLLALADGLLFDVGDTTLPIKIGLGDVDLAIDIQNAVDALGVTPDVVWITVVDPDEGEATYRISDAPLTAASGGGSEEMYLADVVSLDGLTESHTFAFVRHGFQMRGIHRVSLTFEVSGGRRITTPDALRLGVGDGLYIGSGICT